jgi:hypothetical protein
VAVEVEVEAVVVELSTVPLVGRVPVVLEQVAVPQVLATLVHLQQRLVRLLL